MRRNVVPVLLLTCTLAGMAGFAWLTRNPQAEVLRQAEDWPVVGSWAIWFREAYRPRQPAPDAAESRIPEGRTPDGRTPDGRTPDGRTPASWTAPSEVVWVLPGTVLRRAPAEPSAAIGEFDSISATIKIERRGDWFHVRHRGESGWVFLEGYDEHGGPPYGETAEPPTAMKPRPPDAAALKAARELLGDRERVLRLGPYVAYADFDDPALFAYLDGLATQIEALYSERFGVGPLGAPAAALVIYRSELAYRLLERRSPLLADLHSAGHASRGVAVLYVGDRDRGDVGTTLIHELVHFLNRRAIGPALPPWIDEGLADDLAMARVGPDGRIEATVLGGGHHRTDTRVRLDGALATLYRLRGAIADGALPPLEQLTGLDREAFVRSGQRQLYYGASSFWIRYLLDGGDAELGDGLRRFLASVAAGEPATGEALRHRLGRDWATLDAGFRQWLSSHPALPASTG